MLVPYNIVMDLINVLKPTCILNAYLLSIDYVIEGPPLRAFQISKCMRQSIYESGLFIP